MFSRTGRYSPPTNTPASAPGRVYHTPPTQPNLARQQAQQQAQQAQMNALNAIPGYNTQGGIPGVGYSVINDYFARMRQQPMQTQQQYSQGINGNMWNFSNNIPGLMRRAQ